MPAICPGMAHVHSPFAEAFSFAGGAAGMWEGSKGQPGLCNLRGAELFGARGTGDIRKVPERVRK